MNVLPPNNMPTHAVLANGTIGVNKTIWKDSYASCCGRDVKLSVEGQGRGTLMSAARELIAMGLNPKHIVTVTDFSDETLRELIAALEASTEFEDLVYRESELDSVWSIAGFALKDEPNAIRRDAIARLRDTAHLAHDLVADRRPREAADKLKTLL